MLSLSYYSIHPPSCVVVCMHRASAFVWVCMRDCTSFTTHVWLYYASKCVCGSWHCSRPIGGLALTRMSPQAPVLVGCLVLALHVSWLSAVRLYATLGRLPGGGAILPSPWTPASPSPPCLLDRRGQRSPLKFQQRTRDTHRLLPLLPVPPVSNTNWFRHALIILAHPGSAPTSKSVLHYYDCQS